MGQIIQKPTSRFPENFVKVPSTSSKCRGPSLIEEMSQEAVANLPKCFDGVHFKAKRRFRDTSDLGISMLLSSVLPSGGQLTSHTKSRFGSLEFSATPSGAFALNLRAFTTPKTLFNFDSQLDKNHSSVAVTTIQHSSSKRSVALTVSACTLPVKDARNNIKSYITNKKIFGTLGIQYVVKLNHVWTAGLEVVVGDALRCVVQRRLYKGNVGAVFDVYSGQFWYFRRLRSNFDVSALVNADWSKNCKVNGTLAGSLYLSGLLTQFSYSTDGIFASTVKKTFHLPEDKSVTLGFSSLINHRNDRFYFGILFEGQI